MSSDANGNFVELTAKVKVGVAVVLILLPITTGMASWTFMQLWNHENRITVLESNGVTRDSADQERRLAERERRDLERLLIRLDQRLLDVDKKLELLINER